MRIRGPDPKKVADIEKRLRDLADDLALHSAAIHVSNKSGKPLDIDQDTLADVAMCGENATELMEDIENLDTCRCSDPECPCSGSKFGA